MSKEAQHNYNNLQCCILIHKTINSEGFCKVQTKKTPSEIEVLMKDFGMNVKRFSFIPQKSGVLIVSNLLKHEIN